MASLKFNHAFSLMMCGCAASALFLPDRAAAPLKNAVVAVFAPVASPVHRGSTWLENRVRPISSRRDPNAPPGSEALAAENEKLLVENMSLARQLEDLKQLNSDRAQLGVVRDRAVPARVIGLDAGTRQMLQVEGAEGLVFKEGMPAITPRGLVGRVVGGYRGAARVQLTTDPESRLQCAFARFSRDDAGNVTGTTIDSPPPLVVGAGLAGLRVNSLSQRQVETAGVKVGDWLTLNDTAFEPTYLQLKGYLVGRVVAINKSKVNPLMAEIVVEPPIELRRLKEVLIVAK